MWNDGRGLDWQAIPVLAEVHGITDIELLIAELTVIRDFQEQGRG